MFGLLIVVALLALLAFGAYKLYKAVSGSWHEFVAKLKALLAKLAKIPTPLG